MIIDGLTAENQGLGVSGRYKIHIITTTIMPGVGYLKLNGEEIDEWTEFDLGVQTHVTDIYLDPGTYKICAVPDVGTVDPRFNKCIDITVSAGGGDKPFDSIWIIAGILILGYLILKGEK